VAKEWQKGGKRVVDRPLFSLFDSCQKVDIMFIIGRNVSMARKGLRGVGWIWGGY
jgi:hypothetical protein